jgi:hypothetical protein
MKSMHAAELMLLPQIVPDVYGLNAHHERRPSQKKHHIAAKTFNKKKSRLKQAKVSKRKNRRV